MALIEDSTSNVEVHSFERICYIIDDDSNKAVAVSTPPVKLNTDICWVVFLNLLSDIVLTILIDFVKEISVESLTPWLKVRIEGLGKEEPAFV